MEFSRAPTFMSHTRTPQVEIPVDVKYANS